MFRSILLIGLFLLSEQLSANAIPYGYKKIAQQYGIPVKIFYAVLMQESSSTTRSGHKPWPWTLNIKGTGYRYKTRLKAHSALKQALQTTSLVDVGLGQVNWHYHKGRFSSTWQALDP